MTTLVYPDEFRVFVPVTNALTTAAATTGDLEDGFDHRPSAGVVTLPFRASLLPVADPDCNCLSGGYLEMDVQVRVVGHVQGSQPAAVV